jgi:hypothetical protein
MGLYDEDIDWDADLFGQLSNNNPSSSKNNNNIFPADNSDDEDDGQWDMGQSNNKSTMETIRERMKRQMGDKGATKSEGKPDVGWVPNYGKIIDEDEPWFTG